MVIYAQRQLIDLLFTPGYLIMLPNFEKYTDSHVKFGTKSAILWPRIAKYPHYERSIDYT